MKVWNILNGHNLKQVVQFKTRGEATLDLILTNIENYYCAPSCLAPLGKSDHSCILWKPNIKTTINNVRRLTVRPFYPSRICNFGRWASSQKLEEVKNCTTTQEKMDTFYGLLNIAIDDYFPTKVIKTHNTDKPWITQHLRSLIDKRQVAYVKGDSVEWRKFRNIVKREVLKAKHIYHIERVKHLQHSDDPHKWHRQIKSMTNTRNSTDLNLVIPGIPSADHCGIANAINDRLTRFGANLPLLNYGKPPAYLPSDKPAPRVQPWEVYNKLKKINPKKAGGPESIPPRILREFDPELKSKLPLTVEKTIVVPIPKEQPPRVDRLRPISLTSVFAKIAEEFVCDWILADIQPKLDIRQYGNVKGASTSHYLIRLIHDLSYAADKSRNIGTIVLTDFTKAFDLIEHNILINKFINIGVRGSIIPWICDFLSCREQCVKYNNTLSNFISLKEEYPKAQNLDLLANRKLFMLRNLKKFGLDKQELRAVYTGYIRPILEYADVVWHPGLTQDLSNTIEAIQKRACHIILGKHFNSYEHALGICELELLSERRVVQLSQIRQGSHFNLTFF
ncbi:uncharacterized protein LOC117110657 [Anneissia japonica]|uniref:uncharacterized protein LOC117110657 n=1 Tax=Anneissia japonica TaxID=1529436 RepID=UPI00142553D8|nr:uncharacterized protein LOC117110657 [Anneissia japonica]